MTQKSLNNIQITLIIKTIKAQMWANMSLVSFIYLFYQYIIPRYFYKYHII
jgi:hypothetical protein